MTYRLQDESASRFPAGIAILAGGESRRMGTDKASLAIDGITLLERTARLGRGTGLPVFVVGRCAPPDWRIPEVQFLPDDEMGLGPLAGLRTALRHAPSALVLACDLPLLTGEALTWLIDVAAPHAQIDGVAVRSDSRLQPLFSVYSARCLPIVERLMASGRRSLTRLIEEGEFTIVDAPPELQASLENVNTPDAWAALLGKSEAYKETEAEPTSQRTVVRLRDGVWQEKPDSLVVEEPLEIRVDDKRFTITMRTPGEDLDLARGLLFAEGMIRDISDIGDIRHCESDDQGAPNLVTIQRRAVPPRDQRRWQRTLMSGSSCGLCGKAAMAAVAGVVAALPPPVPESADAFDAETLRNLPDKLRDAQLLFTQTGGLHAAGIFDVNGNCLAASEDIGRHNATDKVIGRGLREGWLPANPAQPLALLVSGRASFEIVQKALMARLPIVCSVSAASSLAADLAEANHQTLVGFLRGSGMTIYSGRHRIRTTHS